MGVGQVGQHFSFVAVRTDSYEGSFYLLGNEGVCIKTFLDQFGEDELEFSVQQLLHL